MLYTIWDRWGPRTSKKDGLQLLTRWKSCLKGLPQLKTTNTPPTNLQEAHPSVFIGCNQKEYSQIAP